MAWNIWGKTLPEIEEWTVQHGFPRYRAKQVSDYMYHRGIYSFSEMKQLPQAMRAVLQQEASLEKPKVISRLVSNDKSTVKLLLKLQDGSLIETVSMHHPYGNSICVSTQVGCSMGCVFCASTKKGLERNLTAAEMLGQIYSFKDVENEPIHSVVLMGSGEPLNNYEEVLRFIHLLHDENILHLSYRDITLSTCGIIPKIYRLADEGLPITLAVSLHAPNDEIRHRILPVSRQFEIHHLIKAAAYYFKKTGRRITFEYILIKGVNAGRKEAEELCTLVGDLPCHFNLIPINGTEHIHLYAPPSKEIFTFQKILEKHGKTTTVRRKMGDEIQAACGQLKRHFLNENGERQIP